jgi:putative DNA primase/helicase
MLDKSGEDELRAMANETIPAFSEEALALEYAKEHAPYLRYVADWGKWMIWDNSCWKQDNTLRALDLARQLCRKAAAHANQDAERLANRTTSSNVAFLARADRRLAATTDQWDANPWLLNTPTGTVDLRTGNLRSSEPADYLTQVTACAPAAMDCVLWHAFLDRITENNEDLKDYLQLVFGYALSGSTIEHALFFLYGTGANGKSVLLSTISGIMGTYHCTAPIETFTASSTDRHPTELAGLRAARLVTAIETEEGRRWAESRIKALTGGDAISARFMRQDFFQFTPQFKLVIAGNHKPGLRSVDEAIRRRFNLIPFAVTIPPHERDDKLTEKLQQEWPGILQWMIDGCMRWQRDKLSPPKVVSEATAAYLEAEDAIAAWLDECCELDANAWEPSAILFLSWTNWATKSGEHVGTQKRFVQALETRGFIYQREGGRGRRGFFGARVRPTYGVQY